MIVDRRTALLGFAAATVLPTLASARPPRRPGLQLYTLGGAIARDLPATLAAVRAIGYREVELPGLFGKTPAMLGTMLRDAGLSCPSVHVPFDGAVLSLADPSRVIDALGAIGARYAVAPIAPVVPRMVSGESWFAAMARASMALGPDGWRRIAERLDAAGTNMSRAGLMVGYHNHDLELRAFPDGTTPLDLLIENTDVARVGFELDIGWVAAAGQDPAALLRRHPRRFRLLHLKDTARVSPVGDALHMTPAEPGRGIVDWTAVAVALADVAIDHAFVEQEPPFTDTRIAAARRGFDYFSTLARRAERPRR